jgi:hypothetical protein
MAKRVSDSPTPAQEQLPGLCELFELWLPTALIERLVHDTGRTFYQRLLPPVLTLWGMIFQRINPDHTCDAAWSYLTSDPVRERLGLAPIAPAEVSESPSAYCQARQRLPDAVIHGVLQATAEAFRRELGEDALWRGLRVNLFDGSTLRLPATAALTQHYGTASNQHGPSHWPILRLVAGFDLFSGVTNDVTEGPYRTSEQSLAVQLIRRLGKGFLHIGDRNFGTYAILQATTAAGSAALLRLRITQARRLAGQALHSGLDLAITWSPSRYDDCAEDLPTPAVAGRVLYVRLERDGFRPIDLYLFTTLTERETFPLADLVALYGERWKVELDLRHVKTTLQMEQLESRSVDLVRKELGLGLTAYNLLRGLMGVAAVLAERAPLELSLAQCWRRTLDAGRGLAPTASPDDILRVLDRLLIRLGRCLLPKRSHERFEPRAVWGRPRVYPTIKGSRELARQKWMEFLRNKKS